MRGCGGVVEDEAEAQDDCEYEDCDGVDDDDGGGDDDDVDNTHDEVGDVDDDDGQYCCWPCSS